MGGTAWLAGRTINNLADQTESARVKAKRPAWRKLLFYVFDVRPNGRRMSRGALALTQYTQAMCVGVRSLAARRHARKQAMAIGSGLTSQARDALRGVPEENHLTDSVAE